MSDESTGRAHDDAPAPPASTRWAEEAVEDDPGLTPPFTPGRAEGGGASSAQPGEGRPEGQDEEWTEGSEFPFEAEGTTQTLEEAEPWSVEEEVASERDDADEPFPFETFDFEDDQGSGTAEQGAPEEAAMEILPLDALEAAPDAGPEGDVAAVLERIAALLREEGVDAVRAEMDSSDRLTALLAGLVAGYVSGRS